MAENKKVTILGVGGHGSAAYRDLITNPDYQDYEIHTILGVDDSGGHTGILQRILPLMDLEVDTSKFVPIGDLRANIERFVFDTCSDPALAKLHIDVMSGAYKGSDINEFIKYCLEFCTVFNITDDKLIEGFISFCTKYLNVYNQTESAETKHKIGNLFLTYLLYKVGMDHQKFFEFLREKGFIPPRVFPHFLFNEALTLSARNLDTNLEYIGEEKVDEATLPISPSTYSLVRKNGKPLTIEDIQSDHPETIEAIKASELIVLSTGSIANLFGQLNTLAPELREHDGMKVWLGNFSTTRNEAPFVVLATYYYAEDLLGLDGVLLQMSEAAFDNLTINAENSVWVEKYRKQGKIFGNITDLMTSIKMVFNHNGLAKVVNLVQPVLGITVAGENIATRVPGWNNLLEDEKEKYKVMLEQGGIKHVSTEITIFVQFFYELHSFLKFDLGIENREERYYVISELLRVLNLAEKENPAEEVKHYLEILKEPSEGLETIEAKINKLLTPAGEELRGLFGILRNRITEVTEAEQPDIRFN